MIDKTEFHVRNSNGDKEPWKPDKIRQTILSETDLNDELATKIKNRIQRKINRLREEEGLEWVTKSDIRSEVSAQLLKEGEFKALGQNRPLGMTVHEFENLMLDGCKDNANMDFNPEMISKYAYDSIAKEYALLKMPKDCAEAHINGFVHHHDLEYATNRPNCFNADLRFYAKNGLKIDGKGLMGSVAKPAKTLEVLLNHLLQAWMAGATVFSGGQGYINFNTLLAPFAKGRTYEEIKQAIQGFIFNCNMSLICRGGQVLFSSIGVDLSVPNVLANEPAIGPGGVPNGVYADYQEEADLIFRAICEVSNEKDGNGAYHRFPNILFNIRRGDLDEYSGTCKLLHETGANNPTIYYVNCTELERTVMGALTSDTPVMTKKGFRYPESLDIGDNVMIGPHTLITTVGHPLSPMGRRNHLGIAKPVTIGNDFWMGAGAIVLPGVTIGNNVVVAAGAVVLLPAPPAQAERPAARSAAVSARNLCRCTACSPVWVSLRESLAYFPS